MNESILQRHSENDGIRGRRVGHDQLRPRGQPQLLQGLLEVGSRGLLNARDL